MLLHPSCTPCSEWHSMPVLWMLCLSMRGTNDLLQSTEPDPYVNLLSWRCRLVWLKTEKGASVLGLALNWLTASALKASCGRLLAKQGGQKRLWTRARIGCRRWSRRLTWGSGGSHPQAVAVVSHGALYPVP